MIRFEDLKKKIDDDIEIRVYNTQIVSNYRTEQRSKQFLNKCIKSMIH